MTKQNKKGSTSATRESSVKSVKTSKITSGTVNADELNFINVGKDGIVVKSKEIHFK